MHMKALFSGTCEHIGWIDPERAIFDPAMNYVAFIAGKNAWSASEVQWLGSVDVLTLRDRSGLPIAWTPDHPLTRVSNAIPPVQPIRPPVPIRPKRPINPKRPLLPQVPLGGWSPLTFDEWLYGEAGKETDDSA